MDITTNTQSNDLVELLREELERRKQRNPSYSLRAFAQFLEVSPAQLSQLLSGKRSFTPNVVMQICRALNFSPEQERNILAQILMPKGMQFIEDRSKRQLKEDEFRYISEWYHFAILSLAKIRNAKADPFWVADRLGITPAEARDAIERLQRMNILEDSKLLKRKANSLNVVSDSPSRAIQAYHSKILNLALDRMPTVPLEKRDYSAMTFLADPRKLEAARKMVEEFQDKLVDFLETPNAKEVFVIACQIFPLERIEK